MEYDNEDDSEAARQTQQASDGWSTERIALLREPRAA